RAPWLGQGRSPHRSRSPPSALLPSMCPPCARAGKLSQKTLSGAGSLRFELRPPGVQSVHLGARGLECRVARGERRRIGGGLRIPGGCAACLHDGLGGEHGVLHGVPFPLLEIAEPSGPRPLACGSTIDRRARWAAARGSRLLPLRVIREDLDAAL